MVQRSAILATNSVNGCEQLSSQSHRLLTGRLAGMTVRMTVVHRVQRLYTSSKSRKVWWWHPASVNFRPNLGYGTSADCPLRLQAYHASAGQTPRHRAPAGQRQPGLLRGRKDDRAHRSCRRTYRSDIGLHRPLTANIWALRVWGCAGRPEARCDGPISNSIQGARQDGYARRVREVDDPLERLEPISRGRESRSQHDLPAGWRLS